MLFTFNLAHVGYFVSNIVWKGIQVKVFPELSPFLSTVPINCEKMKAPVSVLIF